MKVVRKKDGRLVASKREKTESEKEFADAWQQVKEKRGIKPPEKPMETNQSLPHSTSETASEEKKVERKKVKIPKEKTIASSQASNVAAKPSTLLRKKPKFEDTHKRVTTYMTHTNDRKLKMIKEQYGLSATKVLNHALSEYFSKLKL